VLAPGTRRCLPRARRECRPLTLLYAAGLHPFAWPQPPAASRQRGRAPLAPEAPSFDECPRYTDRSMLACPPPRGGFAHLATASDAPFVSRRIGRETRPRALDPLFTGRATGPRAARRRLPSADPQAPTIGPRPSRGWAARLSPRHTNRVIRRDGRDLLAQTADDRSEAGRRTLVRGAPAAFTAARAFPLDGSRWKLLPK
jgi:hypothetical protein